MSLFTDIQSLDFSKIRNINVKNGFVLYSQPTQNHNMKLPNIATGGAYQKGNIIYDLSETNNTGTIIGSPTLENIDRDIIYNYITCLIPGFFPSIGGKWSIDQDYYNLEKILDSEKTISKVLGTGIGKVESYQVSDVCRNGVSAMVFNLDIGLDINGEVTGGNLFDPLRLINTSSLIKGYKYPYTTIGNGYYLEGTNWNDFLGLNNINGTNTFPFNAWGGVRIGTLLPQNFQYVQNSLYSYPAFYLNQAKSYNPLGLIYPGQCVQMNSFPISNTGRNITLDEKNDRTYRIPVLNKIQETRKVGILPYQEGRGIYDYFIRDVIYDTRDGQVVIANYQSRIPSEGAIPGRNVSCWGMSISDTWSPDLNMSNLIAGSRTSNDIRTSNNKASHNAPLCYIEKNEKDNSENVLPWNPLFGYIGNTTSSSSNIRSSNCNIIRDGITTGIISGAYPIYKGSFSSEWSGYRNRGFYNTGNVMYDQYYITEDFWNPNIKDPSTPQINSLDNEVFPIQPNPPYRIKGGKIVLFEGQRVIAGSYVYSTINMIPNVTMPQFFPPAGKEIILNEGEKDNIISDIYSKYQSNQGGLIVMVINEGAPPPTPPSNAVPVGVILEDIIGYGTPESFNNDIRNNIEYVPILDNNTPDSPNTSQAKIIPENVKQIQATNILFKLFSMTPQLSLNAFPTPLLSLIFVPTFPLPFTVSFGNFNDVGGSSEELVIQPIFNRIKTNYYLPIGSSGYSTSFSGTFIDGWSMKEKQDRQDYPIVV